MVICAGSLMPHDPRLIGCPNCDMAGKIFFEKSSGQILSSGPLRQASPEEYVTQ